MNNLAALGEKKYQEEKEKHEITKLVLSKAIDLSNMLFREI